MGCQGPHPGPRTEVLAGVPKWAATSLKSLAWVILAKGALDRGSLETPGRRL